MQIQNRAAVRPLARVAPAAAPQAAEAPKPAARPAVKAQAQGGIKTTVQVFKAAAGAVGGGGLGAFTGGAVWFMANAGGTALSANVIGLGLLAGAAICGYIGWKSGAFWGDAIEGTLKK